MSVLWLRKPKCAGTSIYSTLKKHCTLSLEKPGKVSICYAYDFAARGPNVGLQEFQRRYPEFFESAWKFTVVRNPWDKVISSWFYCKSTRHRSLKDVLTNLPALPENLAFDPKTLMDQIHDWHHFTRTQYELGSDVHGNFVADYVVRFEDLPGSLAPVFDKLEIKMSSLPKLNTTQRTHYRGYYTPDTRDLVRDIYARDIEYFGYDF